MITDIQTGSIRWLSSFTLVWKKEYIGFLAIIFSFLRETSD